MSLEVGVVIQPAGEHLLVAIRDADSGRFAA